MSESIYYRVETDSILVPAFLAALEQMQVFRAAVNKFLAKHKAKLAYGGGVCGISGVNLFEGDLVPDGWRKVPKYGFFVPDKRTKQGKLLAQELAALPKNYDALSFSEYLGGIAGVPLTYLGGRAIKWSDFALFGGTIILAVPTECKLPPPGCTRIKESEYWQLVEAEQEATKQPRPTDETGGGLVEQP